MPQAHCHPRLILNLSAQPDSCTPSANETTDREAALELLQFGRAFPRILQALWEADPVQGPVRIVEDTRSEERRVFNDRADR